jgi:lysophospholipase L1-like esterase
MNNSRSCLRNPLFFSCHRLTLVLLGAGLLLSTTGTPRATAADLYERKPKDRVFAKFNPSEAPAPGPLLLQEGDRLAIIGDSITEQKRYSRIIETYLTACVPQLKITTRQYGWSGETAEGFLHRMTNDCLRFQPTIATLCYGMNDFKYRPFDLVNSEWYRRNYTEIVENLKHAGARVVLGSAGAVGMVPPWVDKRNEFTMDELNESLCAFRDIDVEIAQSESVRFADIFWPMLKAGVEAQARFGTAEHPYHVSGPDGVHPDWAGHVIMAYAFLHTLGLDGNIGTLTVDLAAQKAEASAGHQVDSFAGGILTVTSTRYPFCATGETNVDSSIRSGMELVPFNQELNRFLLVVKNGTATNYNVTWGAETKTYSAEQLAAGVNLAADFVVNPFSEAFDRVDQAVAAKQEFETKQIKDIFHGPRGQADMAKAVSETEAERAPLAQAVADAVKPVTYTVKIEPAP